MSELLATFSGAGKVIVPGHHLGTDRQYHVLTDHFKKEVLQNTSYAWYVDHFTERPERYNVRYLAQDPVIFWTDEAVNQRDPQDTENGQWGPDAVSEWFSTDPNSDERPNQTYRHVVRFVTRHGKHHTLTLEAFKCDIDGESEGVWERYVDQGVRGALEPFLSEFASLEVIEVHAV